MDREEKKVAMKDTNKMDCMYRGELKKADKYTPLNVSKCHLRSHLLLPLEPREPTKSSKTGKNKLGVLTST